MASLEKNDSDVVRVGLYLPIATIVKLLLLMLFLACIQVLYPLLMTLFLAILIAVSLDPVVVWLESKKIRRTVAIALIAAILATAVGGIIAFIVPKLFQEFSNFVANVPKLKQQILETLDASNPIRSLVAESLNKESVVPRPTDITPIYNAGNIALGQMSEVILIFVFSIYLLFDNRGAVNWLSAFFSPSTQGKIKQTIEEISIIIFSYVSGQIITSFLSFIYVLIALSCLQIPNTLLLAVLAGIFDVLPVLGFFLSLVPAIIFALSISGSTALIVFLLYVFYHAVENYFIVPAVYGKRLRLSSFVVLLSLISAALLAGIKGAIVSLPLVASYPIIERIWLKRLVGKATIAEHESPAVPTA
jgi:predicted PurR-regulated permease PerM